MARGDFTVFEEFADMLGMELFDFDNDTFKMGLIDNTTPPTAADATPQWSDYSANEVGTGGNYTANGETVPVTWEEADGVATLNDDSGDISLAQDGSGFTDAYWGIFYDSDSGYAIGFLDLDGPVSEQDGPVTITFDASGILTITVT